MKKGLIAVLAGFMVIASFSVGWALPLLDIRTQDDGSSIEGSLPDAPLHDVVETAGVKGWYNANLYASADVTLTYEFIGKDADWTDVFRVDGELAFVNNREANPDYYSAATAGSLLDFVFRIRQGPVDGSLDGTFVKNGDNVDPDTSSDANPIYGALNFFLGYANADMNSVYIALDDGGGGTPSYPISDDNHDDLVVKVTATAAPVPEPATLLLLGTGLVGLAGFGRKKFLKN